MEQNYLQKDIMKKMAIILDLCDNINKEMSKVLIEKERSIYVQLTQDLKDKCSKSLVAESQRNQFECKVCRKKFNDGRQLGGHVSRAHKEMKNSQKKEGLKRRRRVVDSSDESYEVKLQS